MLPTLYVSHGSPMLAIEQGVGRDFLRSMGALLPRPKAILCVSAHWETDEPSLSAAARPETIHDFYGFPEALYRLRYPAPGVPDLARRAAGLLREAGLPALLDGTRGLDHGAWSPLLLAYPQADVPVVQLSLQTGRDGRHHLRVGRALRPLRDEGVLILGSGSAVHNLRELMRGSHAPIADWAREFDDWLAACVAAGDLAALADYRRLAPQAPRAHPSEEHYLPILVAAGAAEGEPTAALYRAIAMGALSMSAFRFGGTD
jgi:4,5-DOPA dioxygenase extradiol